MELDNKIDDLKAVEQKRNFFNNDRESFLNFIMGISGAYQPIIVPLYLGYQVMRKSDDLTFQVGEFATGYLLGRLTK